MSFEILMLDLSDIATHATLSAGLSVALESLRLQVVDARRALPDGAGPARE
mgnify:CR=1 FL=1